MRQPLPASTYDLAVVPSLHAIECEGLRKFGLATNRKPEALPVSNVASYVQALLTHCGRVTQICVFNTVKLGTSASSP